MCGSWVKYALLAILFALSFWCMFTPKIDIYGFGSFFVIQTIFTFFLFVDLTQDDGGFKKVLSLPLPMGESPVKLSDVVIPLSWVLYAGASLVFLASLFMIMTTSMVYKQFQGLKMSSENQWRMNYVKYTFVAVTALMLSMVAIYWNFDAKFSGGMKLFILTVMLAILSLSVSDVVYANYFTQVIFTDG